MNPYKAAIKLVQQLLTDDYMPIPGDLKAQTIRELVKLTLDETFDEICAEENGLTSEQMLMAHEFVFEGGASGRRTCDACSCGAEVHMLVTRAYTAETKEVFACKAHMLDPGPLLDW